MNAPPPKKLHFVFLSHWDFNLWRFRLPIMRRLREQGHAVTAVCPPGPYCSRFSEHAVACERIELDRASMNPLSEAAVIWRLRRLFRRLAPDLVHTFMMKPNIYGILAARAAGSARCVASVTGLGSFYIGTPRSPVRRVMRAGLDALYRGALRRSDAIIFYNPDDMRTFLDLDIAQAHKSVLIPGSGVDTGYFSPGAIEQPERTAGRPVTVTMVARLIRDKGVHEFLEAAARLKERFKGSVRFVLAGAADPGNPKSADLGRLSMLSAAGVIETPGFEEDVRRLLAGTDIYALPSYREGLPVSVLEAMSMARPVVSTEAPGCREAVAHGVTGLLVPVGDAAALSDALETLIKDPEGRRRMGDAGRQRALELFSTDKIVGEHLELYKRVMNA